MMIIYYICFIVKDYFKTKDYDIIWKYFINSIVISNLIVDSKQRIHIMLRGIMFRFLALVEKYDLRLECLLVRNWEGRFKF